MRFVCIVLAIAACAAGVHANAATPDQVLVLYNADYTVDAPGSEPGQDSKEVAEHYVRRHTNLLTGQKPHILGLSCVHGKDHLNEFRLPEESKDNYWGVEYIGGEDKPGSWPVLDSREVEVTLSKDELDKIDLNSVVIAAGKKPDRGAATVVFEKGAHVSAPWLEHSTSDKGCTWKMNLRAFSPGVVHLWLEASDADGNVVKRIAQEFRDFSRFRESTAGDDGVRDDKNYLEDIEQPVKAFLENSKNALPDGTLLKDHIVYIVVCHGLPKMVESSFGILRGPNENLGDLGDGSSLQQRLMVMYYDIPGTYWMYVPTPKGLNGQIMRDQAKPRFTKLSRSFGWTRDGVRRNVITNSLSYCMVAQFNPYMFPSTFRLGMQNKLEGIFDQARYADPADRLEPLFPEGRENARMPRLTPELRARWPKQNFLYAVMRIDGRTPEIAKTQIDTAVYGSRYFTPQMGTCYNKLAGPNPIQPAVRRGIDQLKELGFTLQPEINKPPRIIERPLIHSSYFADGPRYYDDGDICGWNGVLPGGIVNAIKSGNGWNRNNDQFGRYLEKMIEAGATVTAGLGAPGGGHITSASWWDDGVLFHHLFQGYQLGEAMLMSSFYLDWVNAYVGDPLYEPNVTINTKDTTAPIPVKDAVATEMLPGRSGWCAIVTVPLEQSADNPEVAEAAAVYWREGAEKQHASNWRFLARPWVVLRGLTPAAEYTCEITLTDAYGNAARMTTNLATPAEQPARVVHEEQAADGRLRAISIPQRVKIGERASVSADAGEVEIEFTPQKEKFTLMNVSGLRLTSDRLEVGGGTALMHEPLKFEPGRRYHISARWRDRPATREVYLRAPDGAEFLAASNNIIPWPKTADGGGPAIHGTLNFGDANVTIHSVRVYDSADPAPDDHRQPYVRKFARDEFDAAYGAGDGAD